MSVEQELGEQEVGFKVFVGNLSYATTEETLRETFSHVGKV